MIIPNALVLVALLVAGCAALVSATTFIVGGDQGWMTGVDYTAWLSNKTFAAGDKLAAHALERRVSALGIAVFKYFTKEHTVTEVRKKDYFACYGGDALSSDDSGETNVTLTGPGTRYFICNVTVHCVIGMKLAATVPGAAPPPGGATSTGARIPAAGAVAAAAGALAKLVLLI
ncbi:hypothetical protein ACP70R_006999 [Stipagrostis hirtigluma subsp. patula]